MSKSNKKNLIIGGLLAIVLIMAVGYAAFATNLNINGSSAITSNWDVHIKDNGVNAKNATSGAESTKARKVDALTGEFACTLQVPGTSSIEYDIEVENLGSFDAVLDTVTISGTTEAVSAVVTESSSLKQGDTITKNGGTDTLTIKVSLNDISSLPDVTTIDITVKLDFSQATSGSGGGDTPTPSSLVIDQTFVPQYYEYHRDTDDTGSVSIGRSYDASTWANDASTLGKDYYLGHDVDSTTGNVTANYVCFIIDNTQYCMKAIDSAGTNYFPQNKALLGRLQTAEKITCSTFSSNKVECSSGSLGYLRAVSSSGNVVAGLSISVKCDANSDGRSACHE